MNDTPQASTSNSPCVTRRRVFVIEDHGLMRRCLIEAIEHEPDLTVCGEADDMEPALAGIASSQPDLVLTDLQLKSSSGLDLIKLLRVRSPQIPVVATTMFNVNRNERLARSAGAAEFVFKTDGPGKLIARIRELLKRSADLRGSN